MLETPEVLRVFSGGLPKDGESARGCTGEKLGRIGELWESRETVLAWLVCEVTDGEAARPLRPVVMGTNPVSFA
jgi:hypothetical protein